MLKTLLIFSLFLVSFSLKSQTNFNNYFENTTLRFDYIRAGNSEENNIYFYQLKTEPFWSGNPNSLIDKFEYGHYYYQIYDSISGEKIFSRGYNTLYDEWQATAEARSMKKAFYETIIFPMPKKTVKLELLERAKNGLFVKQYEIFINPSDKFIIRDNPSSVPFEKILFNGDPNFKVDIVFLPDGYSADEMSKFIEDAKTYTGYMLGCSPFLEFKDDFNFWAVKYPSYESGVDNPGENIWKNSSLGSSYYSLDVERYLMTLDIKTVRDLAGVVPYDNICIISNSAKYGGGAIYNYYTSFPNENPDGAYLIVHEFGHHFAALGDEYYTSQVSVEDYYNLEIEPYEANLTTLVDFGRKWKDMLDPSTPVPTPTTEQYKNTLGAFEGGGYVSKGVYRPMQDCTMKTRTYNNFCPVCKKALIGMIKYYTGAK